VKKVEAVMERHRALSAADYSDDALYRSLVAESLDVTSMAQSALQLWLRNVLWKIHKLEEKPLLECHRNLETFLRRRYAYAATEEERRAAAFELCRVRHLMSSDVNEVDGNGEPPLVAWAARGGSGEDVALLVAAGADFTAVEASNRCAMHFAAQQGHVEAINALVHVGANCNQMRQSRVGATDKGETPIWRASANGHLGTVKALCEAGADVNQAAALDGSTPLFMASQMGHSSVVEVLLAWGADINQANTVDGCTPILIASRFGYSVIVKALLAAGGDVSKSLTSGPNKGASLVWAAAFSGRSECLQLLLAAGCDVNACTDDGRSPVDIATANGHTHMVQRLLSAGASQSSRAALGFRDLPAQYEYAANDP
jgi:ankyrin repeat protein